MGEVKLWTIPLEVETRLFSDAQFVQSSLQTLRLFSPEFPLIVARIKHLRGELSGAIQEYVTFRLAEKLPLVNDKKKTIPKEIQDGLDVYATYYLAFPHSNETTSTRRSGCSGRRSSSCPNPARTSIVQYVSPWCQGQPGPDLRNQERLARAIAYYGQRDPTKQYRGNLLRARELVWHNPMAAAPDPLFPSTRSTPGR